MESTCGCCSAKLEERGSGYKRTLIESKFRGERTSDILFKNFFVNVTPGKSVIVCSDCCQIIRSVGLKRVQLLDAEEKFRKVRQPDSYIGKKIPTTPTHRSASKKQRVISTARRAPNTSPKNKIAKQTEVTDEEQCQGGPSGSGVTITLNPSKSKGKALLYISKSKYRLGIKSLLEGSKSARKDTIHIISNYVRKEMLATSNYWGKQDNTGLEAITKFSWENVITVAKNLCPITFEILSASLTKKSHQRQLTKRLKSKTVSLLPNVGILLCVIGFVLSRKCDSLQHIISLMMWLGGCKQKVFRGFNRLGLCQSIGATRKRIDAIRQSFDVKVIEWRDKLNAEETSQETDEDSDGTLQNLEDIWEDKEIVDVSIGDSSSEPSTNEVSSTEEQSELSSESDITEESEGAFSSSAESQSCVSSKQKSTKAGKLYYDITFDNVNQKIGVRHHVRGKKNTMLNMVQAYATHDRIPNSLSNKMPSVDEIRQIPIAELLPSKDDEVQLKEELSVIISRILTSHVPAFADLDCVWSIPHQYSELSSMKSEIVPMGILNKDESTIAGMTSILEDYKKYVPEYKDNDPVPIILFCDGLSCERIEGVQRARINGKDSWARLDMFEPAIQEWHRRLMFVQDIYDELFSFDSHRDKGTLYNLKQLFDHNGVSKNVMECFDTAEELLEFATEGYTILYAMKLTNMQNITDIPTDYPEDLDKQKQFMNRLTRQIVESVYETVNTCDVLCADSVNVSKDFDKCDYCICKMESGGKMIYCSNKVCECGQWFHLECIDMSEDNIPHGDWFCSNTCAQKASATKKKSELRIDFQILKMTM